VILVCKTAKVLDRSFDVRIVDLVRQSMQFRPNSAAHTIVSMPSNGKPELSQRTQMYQTRSAYIVNCSRLLLMAERAIEIPYAKYA